MHSAINFYKGKSPNSDGHFLENILNWTHAELELDKNYIQWLFPLNEKSSFGAPILTPKDVATFKNDVDLQEKAKECFLMMLNYFDFKMIDNKIVPLKNDITWLKTFNHKTSKVTRILKSLRLLGLESYAQNFYFSLKKYNSIIPSNVLSSWEYSALGRLWE